MKKITIKEYAVKRKLSIFNVMKMVKSGKLKSQTIKENGKEILYILYDEDSEKEISSQIVKHSLKVDVTIKDELQTLKQEVKLLREELDKLKKDILK